MADLDDAVEVDTPDLSDVALVIVNVETSAGRQLTFMVGLEDEDQQMSMVVDEDEEMEDIQGGDGQLTRRRISTEWTFTIRRRG